MLATHVKVSNMATEDYMAMSYEQHAGKLQHVQADFCHQHKPWQNITSRHTRSYRLWE